jgi:hypothetical protein
MAIATTIPATSHFLAMYGFINIICLAPVIPGSHPKTAVAVAAPRACAR